MNRINLDRGKRPWHPPPGSVAVDGVQQIDVVVLFPVCNADYFKNGTTCLPCATLTAGVDGQKLLDDDTSTCVMIQPRGGASLQFELTVNRACGVNGNINVNVTVGMKTAYDDLLSLIFTKNSENQCNNSNNRNNLRLNRCEIVRSGVADDSGKRVCSMKCKRADSAGSCDIQVYSYSGVASNRQNVRLCEISVGVEG